MARLLRNPGIRVGNRLEGVDGSGVATPAFDRRENGVGYIAIALGVWRLKHYTLGAPNWHRCCGRR